MEDARAIAPVVCVQNEYNLANRGDDALVDSLADKGIAYVPYFPLGGFTPLQSSTLSEVAEGLGVTPMQVALAWLLQRGPHVLLIPGTSSVGHLRGEPGGGGAGAFGGGAGEAGWDLGHRLAGSKGKASRGSPRVSLC